MKYRAFGIEMRHVAVDVDAVTPDEAAKVAYYMFMRGEAEESHSDELEYDEDIEIAPYIDGDWVIEKIEMHRGK